MEVHTGSSGSTIDSEPPSLLGSERLEGTGGECEGVILKSIVFRAYFSHFTDHCILKKVS